MCLSIIETGRHDIKGKIMESKKEVEVIGNRKVTINYHDIVTTCTCGLNVVLKPLNSWMVTDCVCGRNIRLNSDRSWMIIDFNKVKAF